MRKRLNFKTLITFLLIIYVSYTLVNQEIILFKSKKEISQGIDELQKVKDINLKLLDEVKQSSTDSYIERLARERLGLIKDGEVPIVNVTK